jgi:hypothetical protein
VPPIPLDKKYTIVFIEKNSAIDCKNWTCDRLCNFVFLKEIKTRSFGKVTITFS